MSDVKIDVKIKTSGNKKVNYSMTYLWAKGRAFYLGDAIDEEEQMANHPDEAAAYAKKKYLECAHDDDKELPPETIEIIWQDPQEVSLHVYNFADLVGEKHTI